MSYKDYENTRYECFGKYIPVRMMPSLIRWIENGIIPGGFLKSVICNDLVRCIGRADEENERNLSAYVRFLYNHAPHNCYGSIEKMTDWNLAGGLNGIREIKEGEMK